MKEVSTFTVDKLVVNVYNNRSDMGQAAATAVANRINELLREKDMVNIIFASAPSQNEFLDSLTVCNIDWTRANAFHLDEYIELEANAPQSFGEFLRRKIFNKCPFNRVEFLDGSAKDIAEECKRYSELLRENPADIACIGIGENGHIAFNDPGVADFKDPEVVKIAALDEKCRQQQVNDGCFEKIDDVPEQALTMTVPAIMSAGNIYCIVPGPTKAEALKNTLKNTVSEYCPASILREHENAAIYTDIEAARLVTD